MESIPDNNTPILVVDDDVGLLSSIKAILVSSGMPEPALVSESSSVLELVRSHHFHLVLLDLIMPYPSGMDILQQLKEKYPDIECVILTAVDETSSAVQAMKFGAYDYLVKPLSKEKLVIVINRALERYFLRHGLGISDGRRSFSDLHNPLAFKDIVAHDESMALVFHQAEAVAPTNYNIILTGESGTGKEMLAHIIHNLSHRSKQPFLAVNIASFSKTLFEDEFFGHTKGAYTGALSEKKGFFETAQGGTIFLDEITELELPLQAKLLRVIQEGELYRLGSTKVRDVDIRIICATNRDMQEEIRKGKFREDLFYRLNICNIHIPPLRERRDDIMPLAHHFLKIHAEKNKKEIYSLAPDLADRLLEYPFPGNVRELESIIASAILLERGETLTLTSVSDFTHIPEFHQHPKEEVLTLDKMEKQHICKVLKKTKGNRTQAAKILGIGLRTLQRKLKTLSDSHTTPK